VLISNELKIICKVLGNIYTPVGYRGEGYPSAVHSTVPIGAVEEGDPLPEYQAAR
jgi:hypothetical protein